MVSKRQVEPVCTKVTADKRKEEPPVKGVGYSYGVYPDLACSTFTNRVLLTELLVRKMGYTLLQ